MREHGGGQPIRESQDLVSSTPTSIDGGSDLNENGASRSFLPLGDLLPKLPLALQLSNGAAATQAKTQEQHRLYFIRRRLTSPPDPNFVPEVPEWNHGAHWEKGEWPWVKARCRLNGYERSLALAISEHMMGRSQIFAIS